MYHSTEGQGPKTFTAGAAEVAVEEEVAVKPTMGVWPVVLWAKVIEWEFTNPS